MHSSPKESEVRRSGKLGSVRNRKSPTTDSLNDDQKKDEKTEENTATPTGRRTSSNTAPVLNWQMPIRGEDVVKHWASVRRDSKVSNSGTKPPTPVHDVTSNTSCVAEEDCVFYPNQSEEAMRTTRGLCRDYICYRLKRAGFRGRVVITKFPPAKDQNLSFQILKIGKTFEELCPHLFRNLARQLGYVLRSDEELRVLFERLAADVIGPDPNEYRWGRILALLGISGALSVDCIAQGHVELVENVVTVFCDFIEANLLHWIVDHGGWEGMVEVLQMKSDQQEIGLTLSFRASNLWILVLTGILIISGLIFTMGTLSKAFSFDKFFA